MRIYKYELVPLGALHNTPGGCAAMIPSGARLLHVAPQGARIFVWALVNPSNPPEERHLALYPTGVEVPDRHATRDTPRYLGTVHISERDLNQSLPNDSGELVFHVFDLDPEG